ncbi:hypothetical protein [Helicobacter pametensis]|uniref:hypothetical protein n=1 Tax=Helicobacter pametensis TaxID=95149 RepID=UPI0004B41BB5|nr:hypothetical protein [Helicobacter pametensis]
MRVNAVAEIVNGNLLNQPPISHFENITTQITHVMRGTLFICTKESDAREAIMLGAYGILFEDGDLQVIDEECAWIKVDSLQDAITRLIRYKLLSRNISVIYLKNIEYEIAKEITTDPTLDFLQGGYSDFLESTQKQGIQKIITNNTALLEVPLEFTRSILPDNEPFKIISCTLFDSKIYFDSKRYTLSLPSIFLGYLSSVITLFLNEGIYFSLEYFKSIPYLKPIFIAANNLLCPHGQSGRVLLAEEQQEHFRFYASYLQENAKWAKIAFFVPQSKIFLFPDALSYTDSDSLFEAIKNTKFNFALILGVNSAFLLDHLQNSAIESSLFDD